MKEIIEYNWNETAQSNLNEVILHNIIMDIIKDMDKQGLNLAEIELELHKKIEDHLYDYEQSVMYEEENEKYKKENENKEIKVKDKFYYNNIEWICLEVFDKEVYGSKAALAVPTKLIDYHIFSKDNSNDYEFSDIRKYLNTDFLETNFCKEHLIKQNIGSFYDYISLLSKEQYEKYGNILTIYDNLFWLRTPYPSNSYSVYYGSLYGNFGNNNDARYTGGVLPACIFNLESLESAMLSLESALLVVE